MGIVYPCFPLIIAQFGGRVNLFCRGDEAACYFSCYFSFEKLSSIIL